MKFRNIPFSPPDMTEAEAAEVRKAILSGWITTGPRTKKLERQISEYVHTGRTACLNSATAALEISLRLLDLKPGDEVIVPAYTYTASASVTQHVGCRLVMVDISPDDCSVEMDYGKLADAITERTKAVIPVDLGGIVCDYEKIFEVLELKRHLFRPANDLQRKIGRVAVCADCAHAFGARRKIGGEWKMAGAIADFSSFSFHAVKNFTTAEGGAMTWHLPFGEEIVPDDVDYMPVVPKFNGETWNSLLYRISQLMSLHGQNKDAFQKGSIGAWEYDVIGPWYKCNMTDIAAAMGLVQFERYPDILARRKSLIKRMNTAFAAAGLDIHVLRHYTDCCESSGHLYICRLPGYTREQTNRVILQMGERGIACNVHYKPLPMMTGYKALGFDIADFPEARAFYENELTLPLYSRMSDADAEYVIGNFIEVLGKEYVPSADVAEPSVTSAPAREIDSGFLDSLTAQAKASPRLRMNFDLRTPSDIPGVDSRDSSQRMLNALEPGTQVDVHRHCNSTECFVVLRGKCVLYYYDDAGRVTGETLLESPVAGDGSLRSGLAPASRQMVSVEKCRWHKLVSLESGTVIYGSMDGVYEPQKQEDILKL